MSLARKGIFDFDNYVGDGSQIERVKKLFALPFGGVTKQGSVLCEQNGGIMRRNG